ncbi:MAG: hypothetical protein IPL53_00770 [Ignavibacteria bacterium]|nr:hypothetical protein [Ignavibacteria bacterium]
MKENLKRDYLKYLFHKTQTNLTRYRISNTDSELIRNIFSKLSHSEKLTAELYILFNIKEFKNLSKYFIYIYKKIEDDVINFDNLLQNLHADSEYIENEILIYLSNPMRKEISVQNFTEEKHESETLIPQIDRTISYDDKTEEEDNTEAKEDEVPESEIIKFRESYLELIKSEEGDAEVVYELPDSKNEKDKDHSETAFDLPGSEIFDTGDEITADENITISGIETSEIISDIKENSRDEEPSGKSDKGEEIQSEGGELIIRDEDKDDEVITLEIKEDDRIQLSEEIQEELNLFKDSDENIEEEEAAIDEESGEPQQANALFLEFENEIKEKNRYLEAEFIKMIGIINVKNSDEEERSKIISNITRTSSYLEDISRKMTLEIISNVYQTITLSFEKISESKYDISESTLNLFKKGLSLVLSLIKGDDYYGYKDILKSIENIRNALLEEKQKRETYLKRLQEKLDLEKNLNKKFPNDIQKEKLTYLKQIIKDTEQNFKSLEKISGEYQIYEALRGLSGNLNNFKDMVKLAKELQMKKLVQLAEAGYIFVKFLQNYRINPVTIESTEIFGYIIYNLKALVVEKPVDDIDLFISYLNDPVKIFSKTEKKKT